MKYLLSALKCYKDIPITYPFGLFDKVDQFPRRISPPDCLQLYNIHQVFVEYIIIKLYQVSFLILYRLSTILLLASFGLLSFSFALVSIGTAATGASVCPSGLICNVGVARGADLDLESADLILVCAAARIAIPH